MDLDHQAYNYIRYSLYQMFLLIFKNQEMINYNNYSNTKIIVYKTNIIMYSYIYNINSIV